MNEVEKREVINAIKAMLNVIGVIWDQKELNEMPDLEVALKFKKITRFMKKNKFPRPANSFVNFKIYTKIIEIINQTMEAKKTPKTSSTKNLNKEIESPKKDQVTWQIIDELKQLTIGDFLGKKEQTYPFFDADKLIHFDSEILEKVFAVCLWFFCLKEEKEMLEAQARRNLPSIGKIKQYFPDTMDFQYNLSCYANVLKDWESKSIEERFADIAFLFQMMRYKEKKRERVTL